MVKRKHDANGAATNGNAKKPAIAPEDQIKPATTTLVRNRFRTDLFDEDVLKDYRDGYAESSPYVDCWSRYRVV